MYRSLLFLVVLLGLPSVSSAQNLGPEHRRPKNPDPLPMHGPLRNLERVAADEILTATELEDHARRRSMKLRSDRRVQVEIVGPPRGAPWGETELPAFDAVISGSWRSRVEAWVPVDRLTAVARALPPGYFMEAVGELQGGPQGQSEGPDLTGSAPYRDFGYDGSGIKIAVIDTQWDTLTELIWTGDAPILANLTLENYTDDDNFQGPPGKKHGVFCLDTIYDHAPGAEYTLMRIDSRTDLGNAVDDCIAAGVDIISMSLAWFPTWEDDSGDACAAANTFGAAGGLFFVSAGNYARAHYQGDFLDGDGDGWHNFDGPDEATNVLVPDGIVATFVLTWDPSGDADYDLYLLDTEGQVLAIGDSGGSSETVSWENDTGSDQGVAFAIDLTDGDGTELEVFGGKGTTWLEHVTASSSILTPSNATHPNVISVGAVEKVGYNLPTFLPGIAAVYSSRGPTNESQTLAPDLCAPTSTSGSFYGNFIGTSCSCPHAAGTAAVLWSGLPFTTAATVREQLFEWCHAKDWTPPGFVPIFAGFDSTFGRGGINMPTGGDCNNNSVPDGVDLFTGFSDDTNDNHKPDECDSFGTVYGIDNTVPPYDPIDGIGAMSAVVMVTGTPAPGPFPPPSIGFGLGMAHPPSLMNLVAVEPCGALVELAGGDGPEVVLVETHPDGFTAVVDFGLDGAGVPLTLPFDRHAAVICAHYETVASAFQGMEVPVPMELRFTDTFGTANEIFLLGGGTLPAIVENFAFSFVPQSKFAFETAEVEIEYDPADGDATFEVPLFISEHVPEGAQPTETDGFHISLGHDSFLLEAVGIELDETLLEMNGGQGPTVATLLTNDDGIGLRVGYGNGETLAFAEPTEVARVTYSAQPGALQGVDDGVMTLLLHVEDLFPGIKNRIVVFPAGAFAPNTLNGIVDFVPLGELFRRGDVTTDGAVQINDAVFLLDYLFSMGTAPPCPDSADVDNTGVLDIADVIRLLDYLFGGGPPPPLPGPDDCGVDPTDDGFGPCTYSGC